MKLEKEILLKLVKKLERSEAYKMNDLAKARIYLSINDPLISPLFSSTGYLKEDEYNRAFDELIKKNYVTLENENNEKFKVVLNLNVLNEIYNFLDYKGKKEETSEEVNYLIEKLSFYKNNEVLQAFLKKCIDSIQENKSVKRYYNDHKELDFLLKAIDSIMNNKEKILLRNFSVRTFNNSKIVENNSEKIFRIYNEFANEKFLDFTSFIEHYLIFKNYNLILFKGEITLKINGEIINVGKLNSTFALSSEVLDKTEIVSLPLDKVITIENQTTFNYFSDHSFLTLYSEGYVSSSMVNFLKKISEFKPNLSFYHFGDIDWGGLNIYLDLVSKTNLPFKPYKMDIETLTKYRKFAKPLTEKDKENLASLKKNNLNSEMVKLVNYMLENDIKLEQEAID